MESRECSICRANLRVLGLDTPASQEEIKTAYRDLARVWHPDRFQADARLCAKAEEQFKRIQSAYQLLLTHLPTHARDSRADDERYHQPHRQNQPRNSRAESIRAALAQFQDNERFFVEPHLPARLSQEITWAYIDRSHPILGAVDISSTASGRTFLAFTSESVLIKTFGFGSVKTIAHAALTPENVTLQKGLLVPPTFFDKLAMRAGLDESGRKRYAEGQRLEVKIGNKTVSDMLDNDGCRRLRALLLAVGSAAGPETACRD